LADGRIHPGLSRPEDGGGVFAGRLFVADWSTFPFIRAAIMRALAKDRYNRR